MQEREYFDLKFGDLQALFEARFKSLDAKIDKINGRVGKHDDQIQEALAERSGNRQAQRHYFEIIDKIKEKVDSIEKTEILHVMNCPQNNKLKSLSDAVLTLQNMKSFKHAQLIMGISIGGLIFTFLSLLAFVYFNFIHK